MARGGTSGSKRPLRKKEQDRQRSMDVERWLKNKFREGFQEMRKAFEDHDKDNSGMVRDKNEHFRTVLDVRLWRYLRQILGLSLWHTWKYCNDGDILKSYVLKCVKMIWKSCLEVIAIVSIWRYILGIFIIQTKTKLKVLTTLNPSKRRRARKTLNSFPSTLLIHSDSVTPYCGMDLSQLRPK